ncbi:hypothetical protein AYI70_g3926 [Smittium culicis]|uniref:Uncharacterized protein n=1 Tax=Smittium culicis TaxID=133412 RepID=A0A1R1XR54_9FUNG|nr:hypothetical protein AYI70_g10655 [Smittium culicis]OMJ17098.1 hypothetical protein AYI70_g6198 [Smittium culicis]OMJ20730.1 hypothetical protein AYI70_g3926 [Smittium culicis]
MPEKRVLRAHGFLLDDSLELDEYSSRFENLIFLTGPKSIYKDCVEAKDHHSCIPRPEISIYDESTKLYKIYNLPLFEATKIEEPEDSQNNFLNESPAQAAKRHRRSSTLRNRPHIKKNEPLLEDLSIEEFEKKHKKFEAAEKRIRIREFELFAHAKYKQELCKQEFINLINNRDQLSTLPKIITPVHNNCASKSSRVALDLSESVISPQSPIPSKQLSSKSTSFSKNTSNTFGSSDIPKNGLTSISSELSSASNQNSSSNTTPNKRKLHFCEDGLEMEILNNKKYHLFIRLDILKTFLYLEYLLPSSNSLQSLNYYMSTFDHSHQEPTPQTPSRPKRSKPEDKKVEFPIDDFGKGFIDFSLPKYILDFKK